MDQQNSIEQDHHDHGCNDQVVKEKTRQLCVLYSLKKEAIPKHFIFIQLSVNNKKKLSISSYILPVFIFISWCVA